ncbi:uncharacterized protein LOC131158612 [Malania oleifera]|uniref:uncharacterized protein LOC131158612 n=1 Tax=Malania oleifera TaxID=397392 RepID=UPI0025ADAE91|nr:uncharacterized protein LOC131158612 [Malania oleifera]
MNTLTDFCDFLDLSKGSKNHDNLLTVLFLSRGAEFEMESRENITNVGGNSNEGASPELVAEVVQTNRGHNCPAAELGRSIDQFTQPKPFVFMGSVDLVQAKNWIEEIEKILDVLNCTKKKKVAFATFKLSGEAERWWKSVRMLEEHRSIIVAISWAHFRELFFGWYFPATVRNAKMEEFMSLAQGQLTVQQYAAKF